MFDLFMFDAAKATTRQIIEHFETMAPTPLVDLEEKVASTRRLLKEYRQIRNKLGGVEVWVRNPAGIYVLSRMHGGVVTERVYAGKNVNVFARVAQHKQTIASRRGLDVADYAFSALMLGVYDSTAANEDLVIDHYKAKGQCQWNQGGMDTGGLGPKDTGVKRDDSDPNWFDLTYPIKDDFPLGTIASASALQVCETVKSQVPWLFRFFLPVAARAKWVDMTGVPMNARSILTQVVRTLGSDFVLTLFKSRMTLYCTSGPSRHPKAKSEYDHGERLT